MNQFPPAPEYPVRTVSNFVENSRNIRKSRCTTVINDTSGKIAAGINDAGGKFATGINDTGGKFCHQFQ